MCVLLNKDSIATGDSTSFISQQAQDFINVRHLFVCYIKRNVNIYQYDNITAVNLTMLQLGKTKLKWLKMKSLLTPELIHTHTVHAAITHSLKAGGRTEGGFAGARDR